MKKICLSVDWISRSIGVSTKKDWVKVLEGFKKWELRELGENSEWDKDEMDKESVEIGDRDLEIYFDNLKESYGVSEWGEERIMEEFSKYVVKSGIYFV